ncbi:MAG: twin-arginine translocation signal domain-containing protein, partial [Chitinophagaceae bacterium]
MTPSKKFLQKLGLKDSDIDSEQVDATGLGTNGNGNLHADQRSQGVRAEDDRLSLENSRRSFLRNSTLGGIALGGALLTTPIEDVIAQTTQKVSRNSAPSDLKITDMRYCVTSVPGRTAIIRIDTNQGIYGRGEVRDGADVR